MATITLSQTRTNEPDGTYKVVNTLNNEVGIPKELFVVKNNGGEFSHVANVFELTTLPILEDPTYSFYRVFTITRIFADVASAVAFAGDLKRRIDILLVEYTDEAAVFPGMEDTDYPLP